MRHFLLVLGLVVFVFGLFSCGRASTEEKNAYEAAFKKNTLVALDSFLLDFPETVYKKEVAQRREGILWQIAKTENTVYTIQKYLDNFPQGKNKEDAEKLLADMPNDEISLHDLGSKTFVGTIDYGDRELEVLSMRFVTIEESEGSAQFVATVHLSSDIRKELTGTIKRPEMTIHFEENPNSEMLLNLSDGRAYNRKNMLILESIDTKQLWRLRYPK